MREALKAFLRALIVLVDGGGEQITDRHYEIAKAMGITIVRMNQVLANRQSQCNHRKGGTIRHLSHSQSIADGLNHGTSLQYSVRKHRMMNGDLWIDCTRCGKKWRPPVKPTLNWFDKKFRTERFKNYEAALAEYTAAANFDTNNVTSDSIQCNFYDPQTGRLANDQIRAMYAKIGG